MRSSDGEPRPVQSLGCAVPYESAVNIHHRTIGGAYEGVHYPESRCSMHILGVCLPIF